MSLNVSSLILRKSFQMLVKFFCLLLKVFYFIFTIKVIVLLLAFRSLIPLAVVLVEIQLYLPPYSEPLFPTISQSPIDWWYPIYCIQSSIYSWSCFLALHCISLAHIAVFEIISYFLIIMAL